MRRSHTCGQLRATDSTKEVVLVGWISKKRDLGSLTFIDLRDRYGITQLVFDESFHDQTKELRNEFIIEVSGTVALRKDVNSKLPTGDIEIIVSNLTLINKAETTPMIINDVTDALEETRLKYRYLDLRRPILQNNLMLRHQVTLIVRNYLSKHNFVEVETPILCKSTPEGARDYLVPSRITQGTFYALPQSPQLYKQLLMVGGMDRYFQIARCFRDEDLRADRQPEFTQIDIEMSFIDEEDIWGMVEGLMQEIFKQVKNIELQPFTRLPYKEAMKRYGSDKPDARFGLELNDVTSIFNATTLGLFMDKPCINAIKVEGLADKFSRKDVDALGDYVKIYGAKGLAFIKYNNDEFSGSIAKGLSDEEKQALVEQLQLKENDIVFFVADKIKVVQASLGALRLKIAKTFKLIDENQFKFLWITDFPMYEYVEEEDRFVAAHHPFTSPNINDVDKLMSDKANCMARAYDLVLNGYELLSGSIRIHDPKMQAQVFEAIGLTLEEAKNKFGFFLEAFKYGAPPHGGVGIGLERLIMILIGTDNIKDVVAFPKTASASDLMSEAPSPVDDRQLKELALQIKK